MLHYLTINGNHDPLEQFNRGWSRVQLGAKYLQYMSVVYERLFPLSQITSIHHKEDEVPLQIVISPFSWSAFVHQRFIFRAGVRPPSCHNDLRRRAYSHNRRWLVF